MQIALMNSKCTKNSTEIRFYWKNIQYILKRKKSKTGEIFVNYENTVVSYVSAAAAAAVVVVIAIGLTRLPESFN